MAVQPSTRGRGLGTLLLERVEKFASAHGYKHLVLNTTPFLASAIRLYERFGFRPTGNEREWFGTRLTTMSKQVTKTNP
jgi:GNAT superfamily N-acetyltransferase